MRQFYFEVPSTNSAMIVQATTSTNPKIFTHGRIESTAICKIDVFTKKLVYDNKIVLFVY